MDKLWAVVAREFNERVRTRWFVIATIFGPVLFGALMILPAWLASRSEASTEVSRIVILDATAAGLGQRVAGALRGSPVLREVAPDDLTPAESLATREVMRGDAAGYLVLDFQTMAGERTRYAGRNASAIADMQELQRVVREHVMAARLERAGVSPAQTAEITNLRVRLESERLTSRGRGGSGQVSVIFAIVLATLLYFSIFFYGQNVLRGVMEEKQTRVAEVVMSSIPATRLLAGKVLGVGAVGLSQLIIWLASSWALYEMRAPILTRLGATSTPFVLPRVSLAMAVTLLLFFVLGYVFYAALFAAVGAAVNSEQEAQQAQMPIVLLLVVSVMFFQAVVARPDGTTARILSVVPFSAPIVMPLRMTVIHVSWVEVALALLSLLLGCGLVVWLAARIYRTGMLMYGKRPTVKEVIRWLRVAQ
ncbi:MAG: ABC transporter permease [Gemmatimonadota bacterium]|nr:ABC transporter permease [Gemmatimonadota bacterium]